MWNQPVNLNNPAAANSPKVAQVSLWYKRYESPRWSLPPSDVTFRPDSRPWHSQAFTNVHTYPSFYSSKVMVRPIAQGSWPSKIKESDSMRIPHQSFDLRIRSIFNNPYLMNLPSVKRSRNRHDNQFNHEGCMIWSPMNFTKQYNVSFFRYIFRANVSYSKARLWSRKTGIVLQS